MNDVISGAELMGKVIAVTDMGIMPKNCYACQYFLSDWSCTAHGGFYYNEIIDYAAERPQNCPLRLVGGRT